MTKNIINGKVIKNVDNNKKTKTQINNDGSLVKIVGTMKGLKNS